jgi:hypothetical protein
MPKLHLTPPPGPIERALNFSHTSPAQTIALAFKYFEKQEGPTPKARETRRTNTQGTYTIPVYLYSVLRCSGVNFSVFIGP